MNPTIKKKWVEALRSGEYKQGSFALTGKTEKGNPSYCCLGVLCDLYVKQAKEKTTIKLVSHKKQNQMPGMRVRKWAGTDRSPTVRTSDGVKHTLSFLNDSMGYSFKKIATLIEKQL